MMIASHSSNTQLTAFTTEKGVHVTDLQNEMTLQHPDANCIALSCFDSHVYLLVQCDSLYLYKWHESMVFLEIVEPLCYDLDFTYIELYKDVLIYKLKDGQVHSIQVEDIDGMSKYLFTTNNKLRCTKPDHFIEYGEKNLTYHANGAKHTNTLPFTITSIATTDEICAVGTKGGQVLIFYLNSSLNSYEMYHWHPSAVSGIAILNQTICSVGKEAVVVYYHLKEKTKDFISRIHRGPISGISQCKTSLVIQACDGAIYAINANSKPFRLFKEMVLMDSTVTPQIQQFNDLIYMNATPGIIQVINSSGHAVDEIDYAPDWSYAPILGKRHSPVSPKLTHFIINKSIMVCVINHVLIRVYFNLNGAYVFKMMQKANAPIKSVQILNNAIYILKSNQLEVYDFEFNIKSVSHVPFDFNCASFSSDGSLMLASCCNNLIFFSFSKNLILKEAQLPSNCTQMFRLNNFVYCLLRNVLIVVDLLVGNIVSECAVLDNATLFKNYLFMGNKSYKLNIHEIAENKRRGLLCELAPFEEIKCMDNTKQIYTLNDGAVYLTTNGLKAEQNVDFKKEMKQQRRALGSIYDLSKKSTIVLEKIEACESFIEPLEDLFKLPNEYLYLMEDDLCTLLETQMQFAVDGSASEDEDEDGDAMAGEGMTAVNCALEFHSAEFKKPPKYLRKVLELKMVK